MGTLGWMCHPAHRPACFGRAGIQKKNTKRAKAASSTELPASNNTTQVFSDLVIAIIQAKSQLSPYGALILKLNPCLQVGWTKDADKGSGRLFLCKEQKTVCLEKINHKNRPLFKQSFSKILGGISFPLELDMKADITFGLTSTRSKTN